MQEGLKSVDELADILGCKKITVYRLVKDRKISYRQIGRLIKFTKNDIEEFLNKLKSDIKQGENMGCLTGKSVENYGGNCSHCNKPLDEKNQV